MKQITERLFRYFDKNSPLTDFSGLFPNYSGTSLPLNHGIELMRGSNGKSSAAICLLVVAYKSIGGLASVIGIFWKGPPEKIEDLDKKRRR